MFLGKIIREGILMSSLSRPFWLYRTDGERLEEILEVFLKAPDNFTHIAGLCNRVADHIHEEAEAL